MTVTRLSDPTPRTVALATAGTLLPALVVTGVPQPTQALLAAALLAFLPGYALVRLVPPRDPVMAVALSIAASLALATVVSAGLLYAGAWSWQLCCLLLGAITVGASVVRPGAGPS